jgi:SAM-dependent MidA family methyltransferase
MDHSLYDPQSGYYARVVKRSGRGGDFFTSVDVSALFGEVLEAQIAEMSDLLDSRCRNQRFDLVEAGAGNGRLSADILRAARRTRPDLYARTRLHLVERSAAARDAQRDTLGEGADRLAFSAEELPSSFEGVLVANELLDAMPVHQVVMREDGLREIYIATRREPESARPRPGDGDRLITVEGPPSTPALARYLTRIGASLEPGWRVEINLRAIEWVREASRRLRRGFLILIDYGHDARELYSVTHSSGTLTSFARHVATGAEGPASTPAWLQHPGEQDITAHVDFTSVQEAAHAEGLATLGFLDQTYFLMGILNPLNPLNPSSSLTLRERLALKTLMMPGGLGSTLKVLILGKGVGAPALSGCSYRVRVT